MKFIKALSLKYQILIMIMSVVGIVLSINFILQTWSEINYSRENLLNETNLYAELIADYCATPMSENDDIDALDKILNRLDDIPNFLSASIYNTRGIRKSYYSKDDVKLSLLNIKEKNIDLSTNAYIIINKDIELKGVKYGALYLLISEHQINANFINHISRSIAFVILSLLLAFIISIILHKNISAPLEQLTTVIEHISQDNDLGVRVSKVRNDEIGLLYDGFNRMLSRIQEKEHERDVSRNELIESEVRYKSMIENLMEGFYVTNHNGILLEYNSAFAEILGLNIKNNYQGSTLFDLWNESTFNNYIYKLNKDGYVKNYIINIKKQDGNKITIQLNSKMFFDENENPIRIEGTCLDVTRLKFTEAALKQSEKIFHTLSTTTPTGIYLTDKNGKCYYVNDKWCEIAGLTKEEAMGDGWINGIYIEDRERVFEAWEKIVNAKGTWGLELRFQNKKGDITWIYGVASPIIDNSNETVGYVGVNTDITYRKKAETELKEYSERLKILHAIDIDIISGKSPRFVANEALNKLDNLIPYQLACVSLYENELVNLAIKSNIKDQEYPKSLMCEKIKESTIELLENGNIHFKDNLKVTGINSELIIPLLVKDKLIGILKLAASSRKIFNNKNIEIAKEIANQLAIAIEQHRLHEEVIKYTHELEDRVEERTKQLENSNQELREFAQIVSHDLKAPLRAIGQLSFWISKDYSEVIDDEGKEKLELLTGRVKRLDKLIDGILKYSRAGKLVEMEENIDLNIVVKEMIKLLDPPENISIIIDNELPTVYGDLTRISQLFQNLINNAIKFNDKSNGLVNLGSSANGDYWKFYVKDNGLGIEEKYHDRIFQIFQRLVSRDEQEGTGVGLSIVSKIVKIYGGKIWLDSELGKGTIFYFTLPSKNIN